ncbi:LytR/AlgR family response regulator transcription factor [Saccharicrinis aurantiacus]|uniref:LytR/AlgR family response regulator transcription factor n=1 Tax=Saccharicrinis aurantiacus TaxID=1849719 RepID=UPI00094F887D|nr:LytTR family DNA-binding domain-containing protein [Saccharicrinis aurantiacus]
MNVLIIEDEPLAAEHLCKMLHKVNPDTKILAILDSVESSIKWFNQNEHPPLVFMDIHLGDGISFEIFSSVKIESFIIFTTAYDKYALQAFSVNSIDYLLKPLSINKLTEAILKFRNYHKLENPKPSQLNIDSLINAIQNKQESYKERFVVKVGIRIKMVPTTEVTCFYSFEKGTYILTQNKFNYLIDYTLDKLSELLNPKEFYRINRKQIIRISAISEVQTLGPSRIKVKLKDCIDDEYIVSRERIKGFKIWLEG